MGQEQDKKIRDRAYQIWQREGQPSGQDQDHWYRAQAEVDSEVGGQAAPAPKKPRAAKAPAPATKRPRKG